MTDAQYVGTKVHTKIGRLEFEPPDGAGWILHSVISHGNELYAIWQGPQAKGAPAKYDPSYTPGLPKPRI